MDILTIVLAALSAILLISLVVVLTKRSSKDNCEPVNAVDTSAAEDELRKQLAVMEDKLRSAESSGNRAIKDAQAQLEQLESKRTEILESSTKQIKSLESQLQSANARVKTLEADIQTAIAGDNEDLVKSKLNEAAELASKVASLEKELEDVRAEAEKTQSLSEKVESQKKKINSLEENIESLEDDLDDAKKKYKKLFSLNEELQGELDTETKKAKQYLNDFNETKQRLDSLQSDFNLKEEALDFVKEILTAKSTSDESVSKLYENVSSTVDYIRNELRDILKATGYLTSDIEQRFMRSELETWAITKRKSWIQGKVSVAFVGEFSAGKTSIVNRLLSQDDPNVPRLPVSTKATTAIPTYISGGLSTYYQFVTPDNELKEISESTFKRVNKEVLDQVKGVSSLIQYFVMTYKNPNLDKMSILDTPGFNSNDSEDTERTISVINECDALFWVFDVNAGTVNRSSLKIIKEHLKKPLYVVINQIDTKSRSDVDSVETLIRKTLESEGVNIQGIVRFSKKEPLNVMLDPIRQIKRDAAREALLDDLIEYMGNIIEKQKASTRQALQQSNQTQQNHENLISRFDETLRQLQNDYVEVSEIPEYNSRWFSADDYRISQEKYDEFIGLLKRISEDEIDDVINLYNNQIETVQTLEQCWREHSEAQDKQARLTQCFEKLKAKAKLFDVKVNYNPSNAGCGSKQTSAQSKSRASSTTSGAKQEDKNRKFKQLFKWAIIELAGSTVKLNWEMVRKIINDQTHRNFTPNEIRQKVDLANSQGFVDLNSAANQIMTFVEQLR